MTRSERIKRIVSLSENKERVAAREFVAAQKVMADYKERLKQLKEYRQEYTAYMKPDNVVQSITMIRERQNFIMQIDEGIRMLNEQIQVQESMNIQERDKWLKQKKQLDTMENIFQRYYKTEQQIVILREQKQLDEVGQRQVKR